MSAMNCDILAPLTANDAVRRQHGRGHHVGHHAQGWGRRQTRRPRSATTCNGRRRNQPVRRRAAGNGATPSRAIQPNRGRRLHQRDAASGCRRRGAPVESHLRTNGPCGPAMILRPADRIRRRPPRHNAMLRRQRLHQTMATMAARAGTMYSWSPAGRRTRTPASRQARPRKTTPTGSKRAAARPGRRYQHGRRHGGERGSGNECKRHSCEQCPGGNGDITGPRQPKQNNAAAGSPAGSVSQTAMISANGQEVAPGSDRGGPGRSGRAGLLPPRSNHRPRRQRQGRMSRQPESPPRPAPIRSRRPPRPCLPIRDQGSRPRRHPQAGTRLP